MGILQRNYRQLVLRKKVSLFCKILLPCIMCMCAISICAQSQSQIIKGSVKDVYGAPIIGANVIEKGTTNGVITDINV